jgi:hypothetical protein
MRIEFDGILFAVCYLAWDRCEELPTLSQSAADGDLEITVRIDHNGESAFMVFNYDQIMISAIEDADSSVYGDCMEPHDLEREMESVIETHIGRIIRDDRESLVWTPSQD